MIGPNNGAVINVLSYIPTQYWDGIRDGTNTTDLSSYIQAAFDDNYTRYLFPRGFYRASNLDFSVSKEGIFIEGEGNAETISVGGTWLINNNTTPLLTTSDSGTWQNCKFKNISFMQVDATAGHIINPINNYFKLQFENIYCVLSNTASSFLTSSSLYSSLNYINKVKIVMATGATVPAISVISTTGQPTFAWDIQDLQINSDATATAVALKIHDGSGNTNAGNRINGYLAQNTYAGALELGSQQMVTIMGLQVADVTGTPTAPMVYIKKVGTNTSYNITFIGCDIQGGDGTNADIKVENLSSQGNLCIINCRVGYLDSPTNQPPILIGGLFDPTLVSGTNPIDIHRTGRLSRIASISAVTTKSLNLRGSATFATAATVAVTFSGNEPDANYYITISGSANETFWITSKATTGFTINSSNATSTATVAWHLIR